MVGGVRVAARWLLLRIAAASVLLALTLAALGAFPDTATSPGAPPTPTATDTPTPSPSPTPTVTPTETPEPTPTPLPPLLQPPLPDPRILPPIRPDERWIDVNLTTQTATAMIGMRQVYVAYATTGKEGWETPEGTWTIISRVADETMTSAGLGLAADQEYYVQEHVLFTQYFTTGGHALHLNYWRPDWVFGRVPTSHGCVGLRYDDAAYFWDFATIGTKVIVHR